MAQRICPGCRQHTDRDSGFCTLCGFDFASDRDEAYNRLVMFWLRVSAVLSVAVCVVAIRAMGRRPDLGDYRHMLLLGVLPAAVLWGALKLVFTDTRRKLWATALIPSMLMVAAVFAWRAAQSDDSSLSWRRLLGISSFSPPPPWLVSLPATRAASTSPTSAPSDEFSALYPLGSDYFAFLRKQPDTIVTELTNGGLQKMITPPALESHKQLEASRARIKRLKERLIAYETRIRKTAGDLKANVQAAAAAEKTKTEFLAAVRRAGADLIQEVLRFLALQRRALAATDELLAFLHGDAERFMVVHNRLIFANARDEKRYDELRGRLDELAGETDRVVTRVHNRGEQAIRELDWSGAGSDTPPAARPQASGGR